MKRILTLMCVAIFMISTTFAGGKKSFVKLDKLTDTVLLTDLTPELSKDLCAGDLPNVAVECESGREFPVKAIGKYDFIGASLDPNLSVKLERTCYFRFMKKDPESEKVITFMSFDGRRWKKTGLFNEGDILFGFNQETSKVLVEFNP